MLARLVEVGCAVALHAFLYLGDGLVVPLLSEQQVALGVCELLLKPIGDGVALYALQNLLGLVYPVELGVAFCQVYACLCHNVAVVLVEPAYVDVGTCGLGELALLHLGIGHKEPCAPQEGVELLLCVEELLFLCQLLAGRLLGLSLDGVVLYGLLCLLDGAVIVICALRLCLLAANDEQRELLKVVVLVSLGLRLQGVGIGLVSVVECVVTCRECVVHARRCSVVLAASTAGGAHYGNENNYVWQYPFHAITVLLQYKLEKYSFIVLLCHCSISSTSSLTADGISMPRVCRQCTHRSTSSGFMV